MTLVHTTRAELFAAGLSKRAIAAMVRAGTLIRARRGHYLPPNAPVEIIRAVRVGGRLTCLSLLQMLGVFVLHNDMLHVHMAPNASRMRSPRHRRHRLEPKPRRRTRLHWLPLSIPVGQATCVGIIDALAHSVLCQAPRAAIATLDSALHRGLITMAELDDVFDLVPGKYRALRPLIDPRAESGSETFMRLLLRGLGCEVALQVTFDGIGRVDLLVDGWLVVECDSKAYHSTWEEQVRDRARDLALAARGYVTIRPTATMITEQPESVLAAVRALLASRASA